MTGTVTLMGGLTTVNDLGSFANITGLTIRRGTLDWNDLGVQANTSRLPAAVPIALPAVRSASMAVRTRTTPTTSPASSLWAWATRSSSPSRSTGRLPEPRRLWRQRHCRHHRRKPGDRCRPGLWLLPNTTGASNPGDGATHIFFSSTPTLVNGILPAWVTVSSGDYSTGILGGGFATYDAGEGVHAVTYMNTVGDERSPADPERAPHH